MSLFVSEYQYFPSVTWFSGLSNATHCIFYKYDDFRKMSFRNRCVIAGANGPMNLSVPVQGGRNIRLPTTEVMIDNGLPWQSNQWKSITSCYNHAPWFEQYRDSCQAIFQRRFDRLVDLNRHVFEWVVRQLQLQVSWEENDVPTEPGWLDYRNKIIPRNLQQIDSKIKYRQVFQERTGFLPHLSVLDMLFCTGPRAGELLRRDQ